eukprot:TRINITY_DN15719_c0_g3_i2.p1 TRINITY_DN15719_c0_g3~~TRINITY_DN15719_c0_g3_i2.p1  ORF type:complete len:204 (+),score=22.88 TRINITY_DN15719_c0_g3_i2:40-612(+)
MATPSQCGSPGNYGRLPLRQRRSTAPAPQSGAAANHTVVSGNAATQSGVRVPNGTWGEASAPVATACVQPQGQPHPQAYPQAQPAVPQSTHLPSGNSLPPGSMRIAPRQRRASAPVEGAHNQTPQVVVRTAQMAKPSSQSPPRAHGPVGGGVVRPFRGDCSPTSACASRPAANTMINPVAGPVCVSRGIL